MTASEKRRLTRVAELGCAVCRRLGFPGTPAMIHHPRKGVGIGRRAPHSEAIPLCHEHHQGDTGVHALGLKGAFERLHGFCEDDLVADTKRLLGETT